MAERTKVIDILHSDAYCDQPPAQVYQRLLEQGDYLCSVSTMHRLLRDLGESGERRARRPAQHHAVLRLLSKGPHEVWPWDITKLPLTRCGLCLSLYVVLDLFSRFVAAWMVSRKENAALAKQLIDEAIVRYGIPPGALTVHQDRGSPMIAHGYLDLMRTLDVTCSHSRPRVSNDNPFSESQFKTQKYQPEYPGVSTTCPMRAVGAKSISPGITSNITTVVCSGLPPSRSSPDATGWLPNKSRAPWI